MSVVVFPGAADLPPALKAFVAVAARLRTDLAGLVVVLRLILNNHTHRSVVNGIGQTTRACSLTTSMIRVVRLLRGLQGVCEAVAAGA
jgi:hypothetical protein